MSGSRSRRKGANFEREVARMVGEAMPGADVRRGLQSQGEVVPDVNAPGLWIECKRGKKPNVRGALRQALSNATAGRLPLAVVRDDRADAFVTLTLTDFLELLGEWWELKEA